VPTGPLALQVYLPDAGASDCRGALYQDDGETFAYREGAFLRVAYACEVAASSMTVSARLEHDGFTPWWKTVRVTMLGVAQRPSSVLLDGKAISGWRHDASAKTLAVDVRDAVRDWKVEVVR